MSRNKQWRRWRAERKFDRVRRYMSERYHYSFEQGSQSGWTNPFDYMKKNSIDEMVIVQVRTENDFQEFVSHVSKLARDNPKICSCDHCGNIRRKGHGRSGKVWTKAERKSFFNFIETVREADVQPRNFNWRRRGRCRQIDR